MPRRPSASTELATCSGDSTCPKQSGNWLGSARSPLVRPTFTCSKPSILHEYASKGVAQQWVNTEQILPLLDGLDEVGVEHRRACVEAINDFRRNNPSVPIAVCSRIADYEALGTKLR
jgi:hypothetical protein